jgi:hypothetical protein
MAINRILRNTHGHGAINYLVGMATCESDRELREIRSTLTFSGARGASTYMLEVVRTCNLPRTATYLPWFREYEFIKQLQAFCEESSLGFPGILSRRREILDTGGAGGLFENVFLPRIHDEMPMELRRDFAFFDTASTPGEIKQSVIYAAMAVILNRLRQGDGSGPKIINEDHHQTVLSPSNFDRFNDGIIQAALLRAAFPSELCYTKEPRLSSNITDIVLLALRSWDKRDGEAGLEFVFAVATKSLSILNDDFLKIINALETSSESSGTYRLIGKFLRAKYFQ